MFTLYTITYTLVNMTRPKLNRDAILEAALDLADEGGLARVTARELADRLGVTPMALYRHVDGIGAVVDELLERVIARAGVLDHAEPELEAWVLETFRRIHACLVAHPAVLPLLGTSAGYGRQALTVVDAVLGRLAAGGHGPDASIALFHGWLAYTLGAASVEVAARRQGTQSAALDLSRLEGLPNVRRVLPVLVRFTKSLTFVDGLTRLVHADLAGREAPAPPKPLRPTRKTPRSTRGVEVG
jgi:AcrR family transcriptional regulator